MLNLNVKLKMTILPNAIYRFNVIPIKLPMAFFTELEGKKFTIHMETQKPQIAKAVWRKKNGAEGINFRNFLTSHYTTKLRSSRQYGTVTETEI